MLETAKMLRYFQLRASGKDILLFEYYSDDKVHVKKKLLKCVRVLYMFIKMFVKFFFIGLHVKVHKCKDYINRK